MKKLQVLGTGCPSCTRLAELTAQAAEEAGIDYELEKVSNIEEILSFDVSATPALVVDGTVRCSGRVPSVDELKTMIGQ
ncbi:MAG: TM0996/MTH895 family glutaredoxin-like protein [Candidatus Hydrogenedentes bacterium]|nr:TM0996/MTH895 family glutaredoxin-like protein [Candidatus Hydrogenedentota bacterium]